MTFWVQKNDGEAVKFEDREWRARIYAAAGANDLDYLSSAGESSDLVSLTRRKYKRIDPFSRKKAEVLELELKQAGSGKKLATFLSKIFRHPDMLQLYNVDFLPEQLYFYEKDLFPLARIDADVGPDGSIREWFLLDSVTSYS